MRDEVRLLERGYLPDGSTVLKRVTSSQEQTGTLNEKSRAATGSFIAGMDVQ